MGGFIGGGRGPGIAWGKFESNVRTTDGDGGFAGADLASGNSVESFCPTGKPNQCGPYNTGHPKGKPARRRPIGAKWNIPDFKHINIPDNYEKNGQPHQPAFGRGGKTAEIDESKKQNQAKDNKEEEGNR